MDDGQNNYSVWFRLLARGKNPVYSQYQTNVFTFYMPTWITSTSIKESANRHKTEP